MFQVLNLFTGLRVVEHPSGTSALVSPSPVGTAEINPLDFVAAADPDVLQTDPVQLGLVVRLKSVKRVLALELDISEASCHVIVGKEFHAACVMSAGGSLTSDGIFPIDAYRSGMLSGMPQIAIRLSDEELKTLDMAVSDGRFASRAAAMRAGLGALLREEKNREIAASYQAAYAKHPPDDWLAEANAELLDERLAVADSEDPRARRK